VLAEEESTKILLMLKLIGENVGVDCADDGTRAFLEPMDMDRTFEKILEADDEDPNEMSAKK